MDDSTELPALPLPPRQPMVVRLSALITIVALVSGGIGVENGMEMLAEIQAIGPSAVFGTDAFIQWGFVIVCGGILWRAGGLLKSLEEQQKAQRDAYTTADASLREVFALHLELADEKLGRVADRLESHSQKWRKWEPLMIEWQSRATFGRRDEA